MKNYQINLKKELNSIYPTLEHLQGVNPNGEHISFTNHYMMKDEKPFFGICGGNLPRRSVYECLLRWDAVSGFRTGI